MELWTVWAKDESVNGRFYMALVSRSKNKKSALNKFESIFGMHIEKAEVAEGMIKNEVTSIVFSSKTFNYMKQHIEDKYFFVFGSVHGHA